MKQTPVVVQQAKVSGPMMALKLTMLYLVREHKQQGTLAVMKELHLADLKSMLPFYLQLSKKSKQII
jgi:hypothetical protein